MTTRQEQKDVTVDEVAEAIKAAMPDLDSTDQQIAASIHTLMSTGEPVDPAAVATEVGVPVERVVQKLDSWPGVYRDGDGRLVGFWGHAIAPLDPEYRFLVDGQTTYAWCALDTLFIPPLLGKAVRVEASDPLTGEPVSLTVERDGVRDVRPAGALVSMVVPDGPFGYDVIDSFCHKVLFFASDASGARWVAEHPDTTLFGVEKAFALGRAMTERIAPSLLVAER